ncbi:MAG: helix-hairpin-helix domain-containing protein [Erysipelotrichaceae bacterium]|nr:helix-hairpin-helix domain-containing protein [Erysipelotrichaceae bacterium]
MKRLKIIGLILLSAASMIYSYRQPEKLEDESVTTEVTMILDGAFKTTGTVTIEEGMSVGDLIDTYGVKSNANLKAIDKNHIVHGEETLYLPVKSKHTISLNHATKEEFMTLDGIGEKTADKIIDYREQTPFETIEDIMNVSGIGQKRYEKYRDQLCL